VKNVFAEFVQMSRSYFGGFYPPFVYGEKASKKDLPIFYYHDLPRQAFENQLRYLSENKYKTVHCAEFSELFTGERSMQGKVMLTFDDGLQSLYATIFPLLQKYQAKAVAYIVPAWIGKPGFVTWEECLTMRRSGLVDFQSHSFMHASVVSCPEITDIWIRKSPSHIPWGVPGLEAKHLEHEFSWLPVFEGRSLFGQGPVCLLPETFWEECRAENPEAGKDHLRSTAQKILQKHLSSIQVLDESQILEKMVGDLTSAKSQIEASLNHASSHFAFPWHVHSPLAWKALEHCGAKSAALGLREPRWNGFGDSVIPMYRTNGDFLYCLAGNNRKSFSQVAMNKALRRFRGANVYGAVK
jgi:hypothetical protein